MQTANANPTALVFVSQLGEPPLKVHVATGAGFDQSGPLLEQRGVDLQSVKLALLFGKPEPTHQGKQIGGNGVIVETVSVLVSARRSAGEEILKLAPHLVAPTIVRR